MCGRRALGTVRHSSILSARRFALTGTGRTPRAGFPLPQGPTQRAAWPPTPGGAAAKFWGEGTRKGRASLASPSWPPPPPSPPLTAYSPALSSRTPCPLPLRPPFAALAPRTGADSSPYPAGGRHRGRRASSKLAARPGRDTGLPGPRFPHVLSDHLRGRHEDSAGRSAPSLPGTRKALDHVRLRPG